MAGKGVAPSLSPSSRTVSSDPGRTPSPITVRKSAHGARARRPRLSRRACPSSSSTIFDDVPHQWDFPLEDHRSPYRNRAIPENDGYGAIKASSSQTLVDIRNSKTERPFVSLRNEAYMHRDRQSTAPDPRNGPQACSQSDFQFIGTGPNGTSAPPPFNAGQSLIPKQRTTNYPLRNHIVFDAGSPGREGLGISVTIPAQKSSELNAQECRHGDQASRHAPFTRFHGETAFRTDLPTKTLDAMQATFQQRKGEEPRSFDMNMSSRAPFAPDNNLPFNPDPFGRPSNIIYSHGPTFWNTPFDISSSTSYQGPAFYPPQGIYAQNSNPAMHPRAAPMPPLDSSIGVDRHGNNYNVSHQQPALGADDDGFYPITTNPVPSHPGEVKRELTLANIEETLGPDWAVEEQGVSDDAGSDATFEDELDDTYLDELDNTSLDELDDTYLDELDNTSLENLDNTSLDELDDTYLDGLDDTHLDELDDTSLDGMDDTHLDELDDTPLDGLDNTSLDKLDGEPSSNKPYAESNPSSTSRRRQVTYSPSLPPTRFLRSYTPLLRPLEHLPKYLSQGEYIKAHITRSFRREAMQLELALREEKSLLSECNNPADAESEDIREKAFMVRRAMARVEAYMGVMEAEFGVDWGEAGPKVEIREGEGERERRRVLCEG
ncbi:hypothetical protein EJ05DRAFT_518711 [Pseudovirgaria hyperparasitica]|uniref:Uncharacterized protein n=1 Tax=Pseudovirgaria hyperparasitica TaxID=470096 RepID=A0A6A6W0N0_9PEZI|nr:uncharacterized protein EJ05DRAFT_518711 [Pseudovirgaria hyperparasitica]KAF2756103.1 hypothetical protein EJ05DRAFT_518711 [Pseudovirgaria hyperparasitica]